MRYRVRHTLKQWRQLADLTQEQLADALTVNGRKVARSTIAKWESGATQPNAEAIAELEAVLKIKWSDDVLLCKKGK